jgi:hypothetical protein
MAGKVSVGSNHSGHASRDPHCGGCYHDVTVAYNLKSERFPMDCFDVHAGDRVSIFHGTWIPAFVKCCWNSSVLYQFHCVYLLNGEPCEGSCYYDDFNKSLKHLGWKFGWDSSTRSKTSAVKELDDYINGHQSLRHIA